MRILSVDDKEENRYLLETLFKGHGFEVDSVANGAEAIEVLNQKRCDCILSDILMPVMDGFELCRRIKSDPRWSAIPFVFYTATYTGPQDEALALKIGASRFVVKPCDPETLMGIIQDTLAQSQVVTLPAQVQPAQEQEVLKLYNERLIRNLEQKMLQLEQEMLARRKAEESIRQSEKKYRLLFNSIRDAILVSDTTRSIINCNQAFVELFGYSLGEIAGQSTCLLYESEEDYQRLGLEIQAMAERPSHIYTIRFRKKDGLTFPAELNLFLLRDEGNVFSGFIALIRDITERVCAEERQKLLESQLLQVQKLESIGRLAGGVAHDYNNMLSVILGNAQIAINKTRPEAESHEYLQQIVEATHRSARMTGKLLGFARKQTVLPRMLDLNETVTGMLKMLRRLIGEDIILTWLPNPDLLPVMIDPSQVDQILANLCVNARDAIKDGGIITIETGMVTIDAATSAMHAGTHPGQYVSLTVKDTGCGMDLQTLSQIYEPFFTTKEQGKGTGLGLAMVYGIVQQNRGFIEVASRPGHGSIFTIYLPGELRQDIDADLLLSGSTPRGRGETVLLVEDEPAMLHVTSGMLTSLGYTVLAAAKPSDAIILAQAEPRGIQLLLADVIMPEMNGHDLAKLLMTFFPNLQFLYMSGYAPATILSQGIQLPEGSLLQKPFALEDLAVAVHRALHTRSSSISAANLC